MSTTTMYDPPLRGGVYCRWCPDEIEATGRRYGSIEIAGAADYIWRHVSTGLPTCTQTYQAGPFSDFAAYRQIQDRQREIRDLEVRVCDCEGAGHVGCICGPTRERIAALGDAA